MRVRLKLDRLLRLLASSRLSQNHWALRIGISRGHWSSIVNGHHLYLSGKTRLRMVEVFQVPIDELFETDVGASAWADSDFRRSIQDRYLIDSELGQGAMGSVHLARDATRGRIVALKTLATEAVCGVGVEAFLREISTVSRLQHPNILPLFDSGAVADQPFYVMPWIREGSLRARLDREVRLDLATAVTLTEGIAAGLTHAHGEHVLHCDVKPENILLQVRHPYVMDFGISRIIHAEVSGLRARRGYDISAGTPAYVSPEQANGEPDLDGRADVYSLGCVVYEMLTGRPPFEGASTEAVIAQRFLRDAPPISHFAPQVPASVSQVVARAMSIKRNDRPSTPDCLARELREAAARAESLTSRVGFAVSRGIAQVRRRAGTIPSDPIGGTIMPLLSEVASTLRTLRRNWRFAAGVTATLALGVGLGLPVLSAADALLLRPPPGVSEPQRLVTLAGRQFFRDGRPYVNTGFTGLDYVQLNRSGSSVAPVAAWMDFGLSWGRGADARPVAATLTSSSFFSVLGASLQLGRSFTDAEDAEGLTESTCVISHLFWQSRLDGDPNVLGRRLPIGGVTYTVVGVARPGFNGMSQSAIDLWLPMHVTAPEFQGRDPRLWTTDNSSWLRMATRLKAGQSIEAASGEVNRIYRTSGPRTRDPELKGSMYWDPLPPARSSRGISQAGRIALWLSGGAILLLLLIGANLLNLVLARNAANVRDVAIRLAIGGGRGDLVRQYVIEGMTIAAIAAAAGLALSAPATVITRSLLMPGVTWARPVLDLRVAGIAFALALAIQLVGALWAGLQTRRVSPADLLRTGGRGATQSALSHGMRQGLLLAQAAIFAVLLTGSAAFVQSLRRATNADVGFDLAAVHTASIRLSAEAADGARGRELHRRILERVGTLAEVEQATLGYMEPWRNNAGGPALTVPGSSGKPSQVLFDVATPTYLATFGAALREGRWIMPTDREGTEPVLAVNESFAKAFWPGGSAVGKCVRLGADTMPCRTVVGVIRDFKVTEGIDGPMKPVYYLPFEQMRGFDNPVKLFFRPRGDPARAGAAVRAAIAQVDPTLPLVTIRPIRTNVAWATAPLKLGAAAFTSFGMLAGLVAAVGLYSILSFLVVEQRRAHAVRLALGAQAAQLVRPVILNSLATVGAGLVVGFGAVLVLGRLIEPLLWHTRLLEPASVASVGVAGVLIAVAAASIPVRRVIRTDAMAVLRDS